MKLTRYNGHVPLFSQNMEGRERTLFGSTVQDDDINKQFTPEFLRGWGSVGSTEFPTLQDFNALAYTHNKLLSYLYQAGIPSYTQNEEYYIGSIVQYNKDIYICLRDKPTALPTDTNAWKRVQESLTFIGDGPEVMKKGAFGLGGINQIISVGNIFDISETGFYRQQESSVYPTSANNNMILHGYHLDRMSGILQSPISNKAWLFNSLTKTFNEIYSTDNTRTDKNNVLHAGTATPINTLNVSDMSQEVINNDLLTVTSGAVYRALQPKADLTYVNTELGKKADKTYVDSELLKKADLTYVDTELDKKITGGDVVQTTGTSTTNVMSQKGVTDAINALNVDYSLVDFATVKLNERYVKPSPFGNVPVLTVCEVFVNNKWVNSGYTSVTAGQGTVGGWVESEGLVVQTGTHSVYDQAQKNAGGLGENSVGAQNPGSAKCRMHVWRLKK